MKYVWNSGGFKGNATKVGKEIEKLEQKNGDISNKDLLEYAKENKNSETYKCFEWDDTIAGEAYRLTQASHILSSISIVVEEKADKEPIRAYVSIKRNDEKKSYKSIIKVLENDEEYKQLLDRAEKDFISYKERYSSLIKLQDLKGIITKNI